MQPMSSVDGPGQQAARPVPTYEHGSFTAANAGESHFVGSSSGVFFVNTVRRAFAASGWPGNTSSSANSVAEEVLVGHEAADSLAGSGPAVRGLGVLPKPAIVKELVMIYFKTWHPIFPFLHGPTFLENLKALQSQPKPVNATNPKESDRQYICNMIISQCVLNIAAMQENAPKLPPSSRIQSVSTSLSFLGMLALRHDLLSLQALIALQLYLMTNMALRLASSVSGILVKSIFHAGLHRCPAWYEQLSAHDREMRKRIFWTMYAMDRDLSQALGIPLGIQDSDCDVCRPDREEIHRPLTEVSVNPPSGGEETVRTVTDPTLQTETSHPDEQNIDEVARSRQTLLAKYVEQGKLVGRAIELWNKNRGVRNPRHDKVLDLQSDIDEWWNCLPSELQELPRVAITTTNGPRREKGKSKSSSQTAVTDQSSSVSHAPLFNILYQKLIILMNRPLLSLDPQSREFRAALQKCIGAARGSIVALQRQHDLNRPIFSPGFVSAIWMAGLIIAYACQVRHHNLKKGSEAIDICLNLLDVMSKQWPTAGTCQKVLAALQSDINRPRTIPTSSSTNHAVNSQSLQSEESPRKRRRMLASSSKRVDEQTIDVEHATSSIDPSVNSRDFIPNHSSAQNGDIAAFGNGAAGAAFQLLPATAQLSQEFSNSLMTNESNIDHFWTPTIANATDPFQEATWESMFDFLDPELPFGLQEQNFVLPDDPNT